MRVLLFGAGGFVGGAAAWLLADHGHRVVSTARTAGPNRVVADVTDGESMMRLAAEADVVVNCAAKVPTSSSTLSDYEGMFRVNAIGAARVAEWAVRANTRRVVHCSTLAVVARPWPAPVTEGASTNAAGPVAAYAASKLGGEEVASAIAEAGRVAFVTLRFSALYGEGMKWIGVLPAFVDAAIAGKRLSAAGGAHADFLHVDDAARCVVAAVEGGATGVINAASGVETSIVSLARAALRAAGRAEAEVDVAETPLSRALVDVARMRVDLGVEPRVSIEEGVARVSRARRGAA